MKPLNTTALVKTILTENPYTRDDDYMLWLRVIKRIVDYNNMPDFTEFMAVGDFLSIARFSQFPHFETVSRARRKVQEKYPELRASAETQAARAELEAEYREYARDGRWV